MKTQIVASLCKTYLSVPKIPPVITGPVEKTESIWYAESNANTKSSPIIWNLPVTGKAYPKRFMITLI